MKLCPICGTRSWRFKPHRGRKGARCPRCGALERHRKLALYLQGMELGAVLHVAPEPALSPMLKLAAERYVTVDLMDPRADVQADLMDLPFEDGSFDTVICNHVLEHVEDDRKALAELRRVLRDGGLLISMHPVHSRAETLEDPSVTSPEERLRVFGQEDHVRLYGRDFPGRIEAAGFTVDEEAGPSDERLVRRYGLRNDAIYVCR